MKDLKEFVEYLRVHPRKLNYGSAGIASLAHLAAALFANDTGIELTHVPCKSSAQSSIERCSTQDTRHAVPTYRVSRD